MQAGRSAAQEQVRRSATRPTIGKAKSAASLESLIRDIVAGKVKHKGKLELSGRGDREHRRVLGPGRKTSSRALDMRTLCLLLILANALYFMWSQMIDVPCQRSRSRTGSEAAEPPPRIVLAREAGLRSAIETEERR